jgi:hypothetical protein
VICSRSRRDAPPPERGVAGTVRTRSTNGECLVVPFVRLDEVVRALGQGPGALSDIGGLRRVIRRSRDRPISEVRVADIVQTRDLGEGAGR